MHQISQEYLIGEITRKMGKSDFVKFLIQFLEIKRSTAYKYIDNQVELSYNIMIKIINHPQIIPYLDPDLPFQKNATKWQYSWLYSTEISPQSFLLGLYQKLKLIEGTEARIYYTTYEVPIFYYMYFPELFAFKLYCWAKTIWKTEGIAETTFNIDSILTEEVTSLMKRCVSIYSGLVSTEYWTQNILMNTARQIDYFTKMEYFETLKQRKETIANLYNLINVLKKSVDDGAKYQPDADCGSGKLIAYKNEIYFTSNIISVEINGKISNFYVYDNPNYFYTVDQRIGSHTLNWLKNMESGCTRLTQNSELERLSFFQNLEQSIEWLDY